MRSVELSRAGGRGIFTCFAKCHFWPRTLMLALCSLYKRKNNTGSARMMGIMHRNTSSKNKVKSNPSWQYGLVGPKWFWVSIEHDDAIVNADRKERKSRKRKRMKLSFTPRLRGSSWLLCSRNSGSAATFGEVHSWKPSKPACCAAYLRSQAIYVRLGRPL
jgi:hypothetical protein